MSPTRHLPVPTAPTAPLPGAGAVPPPPARAAATGADGARGAIARARAAAAARGPGTRPPGAVRARRARTGAAAAVLVLLVGAAAVLPSHARVVGPAAPPPAYRLPVGPPTALVRGFEAPPAPWAAGHRGVDIAAPVGAAVVAPADGTVTFAGPVAGRGVVTVQHRDGRRSSVEPVVPAVAVGDAVRAGDRIATVGTGGHCASACLHWGVREGDRYVDPWSLLPGAGPVVLLRLR